ncbi:MAG: hypothetical protein Q9164_004311 [Protoblastenia rupestris]
MAATSAKPFSISFGANKSKLPPPPSTSKKRPHSALADPDSDHEEQSEPQIVTGFDQSAGGAIGTSRSQTKAPLVIRAQQNRDWREESRRKRGRNLLPAEVQAARDGANGALLNGASERDEVSKEAGLKFITRDEDGNTTMLNPHAQTPTTTGSPQIAQTAEEEALEALLGTEKKSTLVLPAQDSSDENATMNSHPEAEEYMNEDDRFKADVAARPDSADLDAYAAVPVEDFGAALLRGMGWKEGDAVGKVKNAVGKARVVERRPALLGIGAKEVPGGVGEEMGTWGKVAKGKRKTDLVYNPVLLRNAATGEMLTEEELEKKKVEAKKEKEKGEEDWRERKDRNLAVDREKKKRERLAIGDGREREYKSHKREKSRERDRRSNGESKRERSRHSSSRRERSRSIDRSRGGSSRRERSRSRERKHGRRDHDGYDWRDRDYRR